MKFVTCYVYVLPDSLDYVNEALHLPKNERPQRIAEGERAARVILILQAILHRREMVAGP